MYGICNVFTTTKKRKSDPTHSIEKYQKASKTSSKYRCMLQGPVFVFFVREIRGWICIVSKEMCIRHNNAKRKGKKAIAVRGRS
jgi:hypothetical protein